MNILSMYFKILRSHRSVVSVNIVIILIVLFLLVFQWKDTSFEQGYQKSEVTILLENRGKEETAKLLEEYLKEHYNVVMQKEEQFQDALYHEQAEVGVVIPEYLGKGEPVQIEKGAQAYSSVYVERSINRWLSMLYGYRKQDPSKTVRECAQMVQEDLSAAAEVSLVHTIQSSEEKTLLAACMKIYSYVILTFTVMLSGTALHSIYRPYLMERSIASSFPLSAFHNRILWAVLAFSGGLWAICMALFAIISKGEVFTGFGVCYLVLSFAYTLFCVGLTFFISSLLSSAAYASDALVGITNVLGVAFSFLGGVFVPVSLLPEAILSFAKLLPSYWYAGFIEQSLLVEEAKDAAIWQSFLTALLILLLFLLVFVLGGMLVMKQKQKGKESIVLLQSER